MKRSKIPQLNLLPDSSLKPLVSLIMDETRDLGPPDSGVGKELDSIFNDREAIISCPDKFRIRISTSTDLFSSKISNSL